MSSTKFLKIRKHFKYEDQNNDASMINGNWQYYLKSLQRVILSLAYTAIIGIEL